MTTTFIAFDSESDSVFEVKKGFKPKMRTVIYEVPRKINEMLTMVKDIGLHFITPKNEKCVDNLSVLRIILLPHIGQQWIQDMLSNVIDKNDPSDLSHWQDVILKSGFQEYADTFDDQIIRAIQQSTQIIDIENELMNRSKNLLTTSGIKNSKILTEIELSPKITMMVSSVLGTKYNVFEMIESEKYVVSVNRLAVHNALLNFMQGYGFQKVGLDNQPPPKPNTSFGKNAIAKFFDKLEGYRFIDSLRQLSNQIGQEGSNLLFPIIESYSSGESPKKIDILQISSWIHDHLLDKNEFIQVKADKSRYDQIQSKSKWVLDDWQKKMIGFINGGKSVMALTPTSAGKTFTAMSALECLLNSEDELSLAYIAPTFDLVLQIFNNIKKTFPSRRISLVSGGASEIVQNTQIWVGTPCELLVYFETVGVKFNVGIFDEVHTISTTFGTGRRSQLRAEAISKLLGMCEDVPNRPKQIIALSATIHSDDIDIENPNNSILTNFIKTQARIDSIETIIYNKRPVPQEHFVWNGKFIQKLEENTIFNDAAVIPEDTFTFLKTCVDMERAPVLVFDQSDRECFDNFERYLEWIGKEDMENYDLWYSLRHSLESKIDAHNQEAEELNQEQGEVFREALRRDGKKGPKISGAVNKLASSRNSLLEAIKRTIATTIIRNLDKKSKYMSNISVEDVALLEQLIQLFGNNQTIPKTIATQVIDILDVYRDYQAIKISAILTDEVLSPIPRICPTVGNLFRFGSKAGQKDVNEIKLMFNPGNSAEQNKVRMDMLRLCSAERIREQEIRPLFDLIVKGIEYGVGIILPTMPFVVRFHMLKLLSSKTLKVVFTSHEMSMGINYPIRTVCIRSNTPTEMNVCEYLQMAGRSGRRGLDTIGYVVSWNITNASTATPENLPHIELPKITPETGFQIQNPIDLAIQIDLNRSYAIGNVDMTSAISHLGYATEEKTVKRNKGDIMEEEEVKFEDEEPKVFKIADEFGEIQYDEDVLRAKQESEERISRQGFDEIALSSAVGGCVAPLADAMGLTSEDLLAIAERVKLITQDKNTLEMKENAYQWAQKIFLVKSALQELHTRIHRSSHYELLAYLSSVFELLHRVQLRQMRLK